MPKWLDRLEEIRNGHLGGRGNFISDPAAIGLVNNDVDPPVLTAAGRDLLSYEATLHDDPEQAEYQLVKILYFSQYPHSVAVQALLNQKQNHMLAVLRQFTYRRIFVDQPSLLVIAEYIGSFPGALQRLLALSDPMLIRLVQLGDEGFGSLCSDPSFPRGLSSLCRKVGGTYRRAQDRRLHQIVSMTLLTIAQTIPAGSTVPLVVPPPYSHLLTEKDIFDLHSNYTSDISVWFDGVDYQVSTSLTIPAPGGVPLLLNIALQPQGEIPTGVGNPVGANHQSRKKNRAMTKSETTVIINPLVPKSAEDYVEQTILRPQYGISLVRVGHTTGETKPLLDGRVPGADFYVIDAAEVPIEFIEIKSISAAPPADVSLTRPEYLRACRCSEQGIPYRLILMDITTHQSYEVGDFSGEIAALTLEQTRQFSVRVG